VDRAHQRGEARTVLSLFDHSGVWGGAFEAYGWNVVAVDLKHGEDIGAWSARSLLGDLLQCFPTIDGVLGAPPCTAFAKSGAQYWPDKDADGRTAAAVHLVRQTLRVVDFLRPDFWAVENPIGRIGRLVPEIGEPALSFDPCDFAGWSASPEDVVALDALRGREDLTADEIELVKETGAYTKRTQIWGSFAPPERRFIEPVRCSSQGSWLQRLGGAGEATKAARSLTPTGFADAFAAAQVLAPAARLRQLAARPRFQLDLLGAMARQAG
jgi:hypothetical protein